MEQIVHKNGTQTKEGKMADTLTIKEWADRKYQEHKKDVQVYIDGGIDKVAAVKMVLKSSTLGAGYKAQLRKDFGLSMFD